jgi:tripartite-type tricarboxylate transporter receptor subunit TctC
MFKKLLFGVLISSIAALSFAQTVTVPPELQGKTITMVIPYAPGGDTDNIQRFMAEQARKLTGLNIVYLNRPGANTIVGAKEAASREPNGLTLFGSDGSTHFINPAINYPNHVNPALLDPISVFAITPQYIYVAGNSPLNSAKDLQEYARKNPIMNYGCSAQQACVYQAALYESLGIRPNQVMFKTAGEQLVSVTQGDIVHFMAGASTGYPHVQSGRLKAIAVGWDNPLEVFPSATPINQVLPNFRAVNLQMISTPTGTPKHIIDFWNAVYREIAKTPEVRDNFKTLSVINTGATVKQSEQLIQAEYNRIGKLKHLIKAQ